MRMDWPALKAAVAACTACPLHAKRNKTVFGVGDENADWLFVGEGPGADEDAQGEPFVGQAGKLLDSMLAAIRLKRGENVYIANVVKCRPPGNRNPEPGEALACEPYLHRQIDLIRPKLIVALGKVAAANLLATRRQRRQHARQGARVPRHAADRHLSPGLSAAQPAGQGQGLGGSVFRGANHGGTCRSGEAAPNIESSMRSRHGRHGR